MLARPRGGRRAIGVVEGSRAVAVMAVGQVGVAVVPGAGGHASARVRGRRRRRLDGGCGGQVRWAPIRKDCMKPSPRVARRKVLAALGAAAAGVSTACTL